VTGHARVKKAEWAEVLAAANTVARVCAAVCFHGLDPSEYQNLVRCAAFEVRMHRLAYAAL
jgi:hypothetical protein